MDSVSSETVDSNSAVNEEKPADPLYVGRESLQVKLYSWHICKLSRSFWKYCTFSSRGKGILDKVKKKLVSQPQPSCYDLRISERILFPAAQRE